MLTCTAGDGMHHLLRNELSEKNAQQSLQVLVLDDKGHYTRAGSEVRLYDAGTKKLIGTNILDTGSGYNSQNAKAVHFGLRGVKSVDIEVTVMSKNGRKNVWLTNVDPQTYKGRYLVVKVDANGALVK